MLEQSKAHSDFPKMLCRFFIAPSITMQVKDMRVTVFAELLSEFVYTMCMSVNMS